jgi:3-dehydroquinate dehydratase/shikimate dehydrogenase
MSPARWPYGPQCRICVSLAESSPARLQQRFAQLDGADLVEIRLDALAPEHQPSPRLLGELVAASPVPVGFTLRPLFQGGAYAGDEGARRLVLEQAAAVGAGFVDVELEAEWVGEFVVASACPVVVSRHWEAAPAGLEACVERAHALAPAMIKLVATAVSPDDALPLLHAAQELIAAGQPATCFCMGAAGAASRLLAAGQGAALIYAAVESGREVAAGQWSLRRLVSELGVPQWQPGMQFCGLIGDPIGHSLSPAIFNAVFRERGMNMAYVPVAGGDLDAVLRLLTDVGFRGVSVTMPFKEQMGARAAQRERLVEVTGAANTAVFGAGGWSAFNTDGQAVADALAAVRPVAGTEIVVVGAGGAARAAVVALTAAGANVTVVNRTVDRAEEVAALAGADFGAIEIMERGGFDVVINATPVGMVAAGGDGTRPTDATQPDVTPFPTAWLNGDEVVLDMIYRPRRTALLRQAAERGCTTIEGLEMFVRQAAAQYRHLTGDRGDEPLTSMRVTAEAILVQDNAQNPTPDGTPRL